MEPVSVNVRETCVTCAGSGMVTVGPNPKPLGIDECGVPCPDCHGAATTRNPSPEQKGGPS